MTVTPGSPGARGSSYGAGSGEGDTNTSGLPHRRARIPARFTVIAAVVLVALVFTSTSSVRNWWAHRVHDITGGSRPADYVIGLFIGLLPIIGILLGRLRAKGARRVFRMFVFGAFGFVIADLLAPSPARFLADNSSTRPFDQLAPSYLAGVVTAMLIWLAAIVFGVLHTRRRWRRFRNRHLGPDGPHGPTGSARPGDTHRVIDI